MMEQEWGRIKFLLIYFISGVASILMSCLLQPGTISVGASGAILVCNFILLIMLVY